MAVNWRKIGTIEPMTCKRKRGILISSQIGSGQTRCRFWRAVSGVVDDGYNQSLAKVEKIIADGGYDYDSSMDALINYAQGSSGYDVSYILAAYSASMQQQGTKKEDMISKLSNVAGKMFPVTSVEKEKDIIVPVTYSTYKPVTLTVVTKTVKTGTINGVPQYRYETAERTYYLPDETHTSDEPIEIDAYTSVEVTLPVYSGSTITATKKGDLLSGEWQGNGFTYNGKDQVCGMYNPSVR